MKIWIPLRWWSLGNNTVQWQLMIVPASTEDSGWCWLKSGLEHLQWFTSSRPLIPEYIRLLRQPFDFSGGLMASASLHFLALGFKDFYTHLWKGHSHSSHIGYWAKPAVPQLIWSSIGSQSSSGSHQYKRERLPLVKTRAWIGQWIIPDTKKRSTPGVDLSLQDRTGFSNHLTTTIPFISGQKHDNQSALSELSVHWASRHVDEHLM